MSFTIVLKNRVLFLVDTCASANLQEMVHTLGMLSPQRNNEF